MIQPYSEQDAHAYRAGIIGCLAFGGCGVHVPCCMAVYLLKRSYANDPATALQETGRFIGWFLLPATIIFAVFFLLAAITEIRAFRMGHTPLPRRCRVFSVLFGLLFAALMKLIGDHGLTNALATGWISMGNLWMMGGLLFVSRRFSE